jgi:hypothetical protein
LVERNCSAMAMNVPAIHRPPFNHSVRVVRPDEHQPALRETPAPPSGGFWFDAQEVLEDAGYDVGFVVSTDECRAIVKDDACRPFGLTHPGIGGHRAPFCCWLS